MSQIENPTEIDKLDSSEETITHLDELLVKLKELIR